MVSIRRPHALPSGMEMHASHAASRAKTPTTTTVRERGTTLAAEQPKNIIPKISSRNSVAL